MLQGWTQRPDYFLSLLEQQVAITLGFQVQQEPLRDLKEKVLLQEVDATVEAMLLSDCQAQLERVYVPECGHHRHCVIAISGFLSSA